MHKVIGILGGMSPESTAGDFQYITHRYTERYGDYGYPEVIIYSVSFQSYVDRPNKDLWDLATKSMSEVAQKLAAVEPDLGIISHRRRTIAGAGHIQVMDSVPIS